MSALQNHSDANLSLVAPILDQTINELGEADRTAILLRFFEQYDFRSVGEALGSNEDAARMRVRRALEKLESLLKRHGVTSTATALSLLLSANAVQAAPVGLAVTISTVATLAGTTLASTATATATKAIAMTTLQKAVITATIAAVVAGTGIYEARQASQLRDQLQTLRQHQIPLAAQIEQLQNELEEATRLLAVVRDDRERLERATVELPRLRGEIARLRHEALDRPKPSLPSLPVDKQDPNWQPNFVDLGAPMYLDSRSTNILSGSAMDVGAATPVALLQTWVWAHRTGDAAGLIRTQDFPDGTTEDEKLQWAKSALETKVFAGMNQNFPENFRIRDVFSVYKDRWLALVDEQGSTTGVRTACHLLRQVGGQWKIVVPRPNPETQSQ